MAGETTRMDIVLANNEQVDILDRGSGNVLAFCGPKKEAMSEGWTPVLWDGTRFVPRTFEEAKRTFVKANEGQYVVLRNPARPDARGDRPAMKPGKNDAVPLDMGKTINIPGPVEFALWSQQEAEVIDGHQLDEDQYLRVRVEGPISEEDAKRIWPIVREDWRQVPPTPTATASASEGVEAPKTESAAPKEGALPSLTEAPFVRHFDIGREFIVPGTKVRFFIPPTGMVVRPAKEAAARPEGSAVVVQQAFTADHEVREQARRLQQQCLQLRDRVQGSRLTERYATEMGAHDPRDPNRGAGSASFSASAAARALAATDVAKLAEERRVQRVLADEFQGTSTMTTLSTFVERVVGRLGELAAQLESEARTPIANVDQPLAPPPKPEAKNQYVRRGVRIDADEYVSLVSRSGRVSYVAGPKTVVPCIDQEFRVNSVTGTPVFKAVPIGENSGVLLRTLAGMTVADAKKRVPGVEFLGAPKDADTLSPGTELVVWRQERLVFPADSIEIVRKFKAEHIRAGEARYVKNYKTGKTHVLKEEGLALLDPRREEFTERELNDAERKLWFPNGGYDPKLVPCITVPQGTAALVLGTDEKGEVTRKTLVGYAVHFLEWNERLATIQVSGSDAGEAKTWRKSKSIAFLWTSGNRINDMAPGLRSKDDCEFAIEYTLTVDFDEEQKNFWFAIDDYVFLVCDEVRSRLIGEMLRHPIHEIGTGYVDIVRDAILGRKKEDGKPRAGLAFVRCGARLVDINVRSFRLTQPELQQKLSALQRAGVDESISTRQARLQLEAAEERLRIETRKLETDVATEVQRAKAEVEKAKASEQKTRELAVAKLKEEAELAEAQANAGVLKAAASAKAEFEKVRVEQEKLQATEEEKIKVTRELVKARSEAVIEQTQIEQTRDQRTREIRQAVEEAALASEEKLVELRAKLAQKRSELDHVEAKLARAQEDELALTTAEAQAKVAEVDARCAKLKADGRLEELRPEFDEAQKRLDRLLSEVKGNADARALVLREVLPQVAADLRLLATVESARPAIEALGKAASLKGVEVTELLGQMAGGSPVIQQLLEGLKTLGGRIGNGAGSAALPSGPAS